MCTALGEKSPKVCFSISLKYFSPPVPCFTLASLRACQGSFSRGVSPHCTLHFQIQIGAILTDQFLPLRTIPTSFYFPPTLPQFSDRDNVVTAQIQKYAITQAQIQRKKQQCRA